MKRRSLLSGIAALPVAGAIPAIAAPRHETVIIHGYVSFGAEKSVDGKSLLSISYTHDTKEASERLLALSETALPGDTVTVMFEMNGEQSLIGTYTA